MKRYGQLVRQPETLTDEVIAQSTRGVVRTSQGYQCIQCRTTKTYHFYRYQSPYFKDDIIYCRHCITMGRMDTLRHVFITKSKRMQSDGYYHLPFMLSEQQTYASQKIVTAIQQKQHLLLHAVTGAGKTEMMFEAISLARQKGDNVAIVSPRVDVVIEVSQRICQTFTHEDIDILHQASKQSFNGHFVVATVHQLYRFKNHFDVIFVDEVDAFPLSMDKGLQQTIKQAAHASYACIYMTATPPKALLRTFETNQIITLPARFHRHPLVVPEFRYFKMKYLRIQKRLVSELRKQVNRHRTTLLFFSNIENMKQFYNTYQSSFTNMCFVYSEDSDRLKKVQQLRTGVFQIVLTTTILERGFTMAFLDVWVMDSQNYSATALIQIAGRVGRKQECPDGLVRFYHDGRTLEMYKARRSIRKMNRLAYQKGWIDN
ncbi:DEAD/DEAH box helicase [Staphylococcus hyicus]|uniref:DEAD/DEAH box helicase n=1 Tax=Staphylococcus hyicus TaxID=1284 RepID=A0A418JM70_STAHY|nr:DEAD/DEAH box helicase family protein [Staphylococcus hyicus]RIO47662.1 DEAD/DEAH box helicase [Staphylococcus hyicus]